MGACAAIAVLLLGSVSIGACATSPIRKHSFEGEIATNGLIEISVGASASTPNLSSGLARKVRADAKGDFGTGADYRDRSTALEKSSPIRKNNFSMQVAINGNIEMSDGLADSTHNQSSNLTNRFGVDAKGDLETGAGNRSKATGVDKSSPIRKHEFPVPAAVYGNSEISGGVVASIPMQSSTRARSTRIVPNGNTNLMWKSYRKQALDTPRKHLVSSLATELKNSLERNSVLMNVTASLLEHVENFGNSDQSRNVFIFICVFSMMAGCLFAAVFASSIQRDAMVRLSMRAVHSIGDSINRLQSNDRRPDWSVISDSDGESFSSSEEDKHPHFNIRTAESSQFIVKTGLLWKLERRFIESFKSHNGSDFAPTDRFAFLESWDLRFFSLDVDESAVLFTYVSELNEFGSVVFEITSIDSDIMKIPSLKADVARAKKNTSGALIGLYDDYVHRVQKLGYDIPENATHDPQSLSVFTVSGKRQGENDGTRSVGRLKWDTGEGANEAKSSQMCLGCAHRKECKHWHRQITSMLKRVQPKKDGKKIHKHTSVLHQRVAQAAAEAVAQRGPAFGKRRSSFALDAEQAADLAQADV